MRHGTGGGRAVTVALLKLRQSFGNAVAIAVAWAASEPHASAGDDNAPGWL